LLFLFLGSGCAALIYELVWFHVLRLVIGSSSISIAALLVSFMGGMGLGSVALPRLVPRTWHPLRVYAGLELSIGAIGLILLVALPSVQTVYLAAVGYGLGGVLLRALVCVACLLPPTILMGATLPAVARWVGTTRTGVAQTGVLYAANTIGAVVGVLTASFYLLREYDTVVTTLVAVALNTAVALVALRLAASRPHTETPDAPVPTGVAVRPVALAVIGLSGFASLGAEVVWTRQLSLLFGATVYNFSLILAVFLAGIGIGSLGGAWLATRAARAGVVMGWCQLALLAALPYGAYMIGYQIPFWEVGPDFLPWVTESRGLLFAYDIVRCGVSIGPATMFWGASFPLALAAANTGESDAGRLVARVSVVNTAGALAGAVIFSLAVIPGLGTERAQQLLVAVAAAAAGLMFLTAARRSPSVGDVSVQAPLRGSGLRTVLAGALVVLATGASLWAVPVTPNGLIAFGRDIFGWDTIARYLFVEEGVNASVAVTDSQSGFRQLHISGKVVASTMDLDMRIERMLGHVPALLHGAPRSVLIVGMGAGVTAGSFVRYPEVERIVICEIEPSVLDASNQFSIENHGVLSDPRTEVIYDDARHFLATTDEQFDVITSDPIHPWVRGAASLYSVEYHELVKERLRPGGVVAQWVPLYETDEASAKSQIGTFVQSFPDATLWNSDFLDSGYDLVLVGQVGQVRVDGEEIARRLREDSSLWASLADVGLGSTVELLQTYAGWGPDLEPWLRDAEINRDRSLRLQYLAGLALDRQDAYSIYGSIVGYRRYPRELFQVSSRDEAQLLRGY
jgi:spermidine synthase